MCASLCHDTYIFFFFFIPKSIFSSGHDGNNFYANNFSSSQVCVCVSGKVFKYIIFLFLYFCHSFPKLTSVVLKCFFFFPTLAFLAELLKVRDQVVCNLFATVFFVVCLFLSNLSSDICFSIMFCLCLLLF